MDKSPKKVLLHHWEEGFSGMALFLIVPVVVLLGVLFFFYRPSYLGNNISPQGLIGQPAPTATPSPWKTYTNNEYGFEITYPATGVVMTDNGMQLGECGNAITEASNSSAVNNFNIDNFYGIKVVDWDGSIADYMKQQQAVGKYNTKAINGSGADEAIALEGLKKNVEYARGFPPLAYVIAIYKKGDNLFLLQNFQNPGNLGGCIAPDTVNPSEYPEVADLKWNMATSLKFINQSSSNNTQLANPASVNCAEKGGTLEIATRGDGGQYGICEFEDNMQCEEWALFRGQCPVGGVKITGYDTPQQIYCAITGGSTTVEPGALCKYKDGTSCDLDDLYVGKCQQGI